MRKILVETVNKDLSDFRNIKQTSINWVNDLEEKEKD